MAKVTLRRQALELRLQGKSYSQIKQELGISKSTLSGWLHAYPLSSLQIRLLRANSDVRIEKYRKTMQLKREARWGNYYNEAQALLLPITKKELFIAGLFLYWGEGGKQLRHTLSINNTDPAVLRFSLLWMTEALGIQKKNILVYLHLYSDMNVEIEIDYWSEVLKLPREQFRKPYIKKNKREKIDHKGFGYGTCGLFVYNTIIKEKVLMAIRVMEKYGEVNLARL